MSFPVRSLLLTSASASAFTILVREGRTEMEATHAPVLQLTRDQILTRIERGAKRRLNLGVQDLIKLYRAGRLEDPAAVADLVALAALLNDGDPLFVRP